MLKKALSKKRTISIATVIMLVVALIMIPGSIKAIDTAPINLGMSTPKTQLKVNEDFSVNYVIQPQSIPYGSVNVDYGKEREIVLVMDVSGSMSEYISGNSGPTKMDVLKQTARNFINKFNNDGRINVSVVKYSNSASVLNLTNQTGSSLSDSEVNSKAFVNLGTAVNSINVINNINNLTAGGGTNIGDGLRRAYWLLNKSPKTDARKYIILMTDGVPTAFTWDTRKIVYDWWDYYYEYTYNTREGNAQSDKLYVNSGDNDYKGLSLNYSTTIGDMVKKDPLKINSTMIAFSNGADPTKLSQIAQSSGGDYKVALSQTDMDSVYDNIAGQIISDLPINNVSFNATFPNGIQIKDITSQSGLPKGFQVNGQQITGSLNNINYRKDDARKIYVADPIQLSVNLKAISKGQYVLGDNNSMYITYKDLNGTNSKRTFPSLTIGVADNAPNIKATLTNKSGSADTYILNITTGTDKLNDAVLMEVSKNYQGTPNLRQDGRSDGTLQFNFEVNQSDLTGNCLYIKATDKSSPANIIYSTVPIIKLSDFKLKEQEHSDNRRMEDIDLQTEANSKINSLKVNGNELANSSSPYIPDSSGKYSYLNAVLQDGNNVISADVINQYGNICRFVFSRTVDAISPIITGNIGGEGDKLNVDFSEQVISATYECDLNGDGIIGASEKGVFVSGPTNIIRDFILPSNFYNKDLTIKAKDSSNNIGTAIIKPALKSELKKHGIFVEAGNSGDTSTLGANYLVTRNDNSVRNANLALTKLGVLVKVRKPDSIIKIDMNSDNEMNIISLDNISAALYKVFDDGSLQKVDLNVPYISMNSISKSHKIINVSIPSQSYETGKNYIITYTVKPEVRFASQSSSSISMNNTVTVDGVLNSLQLNSTPLPDIN